MDRFAADTREGYRGGTQARELTRCRREVQGQVPARARLGGEERVHLERVRRPDHCPRGRTGCQTDGRNDRRSGGRALVASQDDGEAVQGGAAQRVEAGDILEREGGQRRGRAEDLGAGPAG